MIQKKKFIWLPAILAFLACIFLGKPSLGNPVEATFNSMAVFQNGRLYLTREEEYVRFSGKNAAKADPGYPKLIRNDWNIPENFTDGFDAMAVFQNGKLYVTKGDEYLRFSPENGPTPDPGYPKLIRNDWNIPENFTSGFDAMTVFPNGKLYVTKGDEYLRFSPENGPTPDSGYPKKIKGDWDVPERFTSGFDAMTVFPNGKLYVTKGDEYVRFSGKNAAKADPGYPRKIKGNWDVPERFTTSCNLSGSSEELSENEARCITDSRRRLQGGVDLGPFRRYEVVDNLLSRSSAAHYNGIEDKSQRIDDEAIQTLINNKITAILSFNSIELSNEEKSSLGDVGINYLWLGVGDFKASTVDDLERGVNFVFNTPDNEDIDIQHDEPRTLVYCGFGHGRTGTFVTAWQIARYGKQPTIDLMKNNHVETDKQKEVLQKYYNDCLLDRAECPANLD